MTGMHVSSRRPRWPDLLMLLLALSACEPGGTPGGPLEEGTGTVESADAADLPDVVMILIDTLRADHLSFYGYSRETAPFLAGLAERSVVFRRAFSTSSWTAPATASLFTGVYPSQHGVLGHPSALAGGSQASAGDALARPPVTADVLRDEFDTLAATLRTAGSRPAPFLSNPWLGHRLGFAQALRHEDLPAVLSQSRRRVSQLDRRLAETNGVACLAHASLQRNLTFHQGSVGSDLWVIGDFVR